MKKIVCMCVCVYVCMCVCVYVRRLTDVHVSHLPVLSERAAQGKLDPVLGRDAEIRRTLTVLGT